MNKKSIVTLIALAWLLPFSTQAADVDDATMEIIDVTDDRSDDVTNRIDLPDHDDGPGHDAHDDKDDSDDHHDADHDKDDDHDEAHEREEERENDHESEQDDRSDDSGDGHKDND